MKKPTRIPKPQKPPILPARQNGSLILTVTMSHERLIGRIVVAWSKLEGALDDFIWLILKIEIGLGRILTARMEAAAKIRLLRELGEAALDEEKFHKLSPILDGADLIRENRNLIVHGTWGRNEFGVPIALSLKIKPLERDQVVSETFPAERMRLIAHNIDATKFQLMRLMREIKLGKSADADQETAGKI